MARYLTRGAVSVEIIASEIEILGNRKDAGGHSIFLGQVRADLREGKRVKAIEYSAYEEMVRVEAEKIREAVINEFNDVLNIVIIHSLGVVMTGEISMFVLVSAGHRDHATKACRQAVELIKERLPVWKKEIFEDNTYLWQENS
jgi:molybdopterin synthase catalytic subunit